MESGICYEVVPGFVGVDRFDYVVTDPEGAKASATVVANVSGAPDLRLGALKMQCASIGALGEAELCFAGLPGQVHEIYAADNLKS
tara:strand:+ start:424 stop:681 length:258 start_codon:yes stop_codon:yes gene_type:complete